MGCLLFGRCHLPNVTAIERLKSRWAMIPPMSTRVAMTGSFRVWYPVSENLMRMFCTKYPSRSGWPVGDGWWLLRSHAVWPVRRQDCRRISWFCQSWLSLGQTARRKFGHRSRAQVCPLLPQYMASSALPASGSVALLGPRNPGVEGCALTRRARRHVCRFWPCGCEGKSAGHDC